MPILEIITIGTEILLGEIFDTNSRYLALECRDNGIDLYRVQSIGDNPRRIAELMREAFSRADIVITTGGLGPTVDDPTRDAAAIAFGTELEYKSELFELITARMAKLGRSVSENQRKQAYIPKNAIAIPNSVGTAPAFYIKQNGKVMICLPGVPSEMEYLWKNAVLPILRQVFDLKTRILVRKLRVYGLGEGSIDELIADLEALSNPTIGLSAHFGYVDVRITVKTEADDDALASLNGIEKEIRSRLPQFIFGVDDESIESAIETLLDQIRSPISINMDPDSAFLRKFDGRNQLVEFGSSATSTTSEQPATITITQDSENGKVRLFVETETIHIDHTRAFLGNPEHYADWRKNVVSGEFWLALKAITSTKQD